MAEFDARLFGARWAEHYDEWFAGVMDDEGAINLLAEFAGEEPVLELAVGTGRLAVPLAERGHDVTGVDISEEMIAKLREKSGKVTTFVGDMTTMTVPGEFGLVFIAFNSLFVLGTQREQVDLFRNAAAHVRPGGRFVLETAVVSGWKPGDDTGRLRVLRADADQLTIIAGTVDPVSSFYEGVQVVLKPDGNSFYPMHGRHASHHEMDLMAELAGLELAERWGNWHRARFDGDSQQHISVYRKPLRRG